MGVQLPLNDWSIDREGICGVCAEKAKEPDKGPKKEAITVPHESAES